MTTCTPTGKRVSLGLQLSLWSVTSNLNKNGVGDSENTTYKCQIKTVVNLNEFLIQIIIH